MKMWLKLAWGFFALAVLSLFVFTSALCVFSAALGAGFLAVYLITKRQRVRVRDALRWKSGYYSLEDISQMTGYRKEDCRIILDDCVKMRWMESIRHSDSGEMVYRYRFPSENL